MIEKSKEELLKTKSCCMCYQIAIYEVSSGKNTELLCERCMQVDRSLRRDKF